MCFALAGCPLTRNLTSPVKQLIKTLRFNARLLSAIISKYSRFITLGIVIGAGIFLVHPSLNFQRFYRETRPRRIGLVGKYTFSNLPPEISSLVSTGLTTVTPDGQVLPGLASEWTISPDQKVFKFQIKPGGIWDDGKPISALSLIQQFKDVKANALGDLELEYDLKDSYVPFLTTVSRPIFKIKTVKLPLILQPLKALFKTRYFGTGNYKFGKSEPAGQYLSSITLNPSRTKIPEITYRFYSTEDTAITAFKLGEINEVRDLSFPRDLLDWPSVTVVGQASLDRYVALLINTRNDAFKAKEARQALSYAIDKKQFANRATGPVSPLSWAYNDQLKSYDLDIEKAKMLLKKAPLGDTDIEISTFSWLLKTAEVIKTDWEKAGIKSHVKVINFIPDDYDVLLTYQGIPSDPDQYSLWHSTQPTNLTHFINLKVDKLLEDGRKIADPDQRKKIYLDFQRFLVEESPAVFFYYPISYTVSRR